MDANDIDCGDPHELGIYTIGINEGLKKARKEELGFLKRLDNINKATWNLGNWNKVLRRMKKLKRFALEVDDE